MKWDHLTPRTQLSSFRVLSDVPFEGTAGPVSSDREDLGGRLESPPKSFREHHRSLHGPSSRVVSPVPAWVAGREEKKSGVVGGAVL